MDPMWMYTEIVINKYPQLLLVLSETNGQKVHQFFGGPKVFYYYDYYHMLFANG